jgi:hypothetical protein
VSLPALYNLASAQHLSKDACNLSAGDGAVLNGTRKLLACS